MKPFAFIIILFSLIACGRGKHATIESFWSDFQQAVNSNNREAVADMTHFPLSGAEGYVESVDTTGITREQFLQAFDQIFDEKVKSTIAQTPASALDQYVPPKDAALERLALPPNTVVYSLPVLYVYDEGLETQTESAVIFYFLKEKGSFQLVYMSVAG